MQLDHKDFDIVAYTDGGCHNDGPRYGGAGTYIETSDKKAFGITQGMVAPSTNNIAEIYGYINFLKYCIENNVGKALVYLDSQYVLNGATKWLKGWKRKGWIKSDYQPISNIEEWKLVDELHGKLKTKVTYQWVKGHSGIYGNEMADKLATDGKANSKNKDHESYTKVLAHPDHHPADDTPYEEVNEKPKKEIKLQPHKGLTGRYMLGVTGRKLDSWNGWYVYNSCSLPKNTDAPLRFIGAMSADYHESITFTKNYCPILERLASEQTDALDSTLEVPFVYNLDNITSKKNWELLNNPDENSTIVTNRNVMLDKYDDNGNPVPITLTEYRRAPALINFAYESLVFKTQLVQDYLEGKHDGISIYDINDLFFVKDKKDKLAVKKELMGAKTLEYKLKHNGQKFVLKLALKFAIPTRNSIAALLKQNKTLEAKLIVHDETSIGAKWSVLFVGDSDVVLCDSPYSCRISYK